MEERDSKWKREREEVEERQDFEEAETGSGREGREVEERELGSGRERQVVEKGYRVEKKGRQEAEERERSGRVKKAKSCQINIEGKRGLRGMAFGVAVPCLSLNEVLLA